MKIAQVAPLYVSVPPADYGGTERVIGWLIDELAQRGHSLTLFSTADSRTSAELQAVCKQPLGIGRTRLSELAHLMEVQEVSRLSHNFDVIHSHVEHWLYPLVGKAKVPIVSTCHGPMGRPLMHEVHRQFPNAPLVSISFSQRTPLPEANWVANVYHGMPRDLFFPSFKKGQYLVFLGRLSPTKGVVEAIEIARRSSTNLKIAGNIQAVDQDYFRHEIKTAARQWC
ncbi:MAG TPA: glycosyltransferase [Oculatellaceae cyanobacterium]